MSAGISRASPEPESLVPTSSPALASDYQCAVCLSLLLDPVVGVSCRFRDLLQATFPKQLEARLLEEGEKQREEEEEQRQKEEEAARLEYQRTLESGEGLLQPGSPRAHVHTAGYWGRVHQQLQHEADHPAADATAAMLVAEAAHEASVLRARSYSIPQNWLLMSQTTVWPVGTQITGAAAQPSHRAEPPRGAGAREAAMMMGSGESVQLQYAIRAAARRAREAAVMVASDESAQLQYAIQAAASRGSDRDGRSEERTRLHYALRAAASRGRQWQGGEAGPPAPGSGREMRSSPQLLVTPAAPSLMTLSATVSEGPYLRAMHPVLQPHQAYALPILSAAHQHGYHQQASLFQRSSGPHMMDYVAGGLRGEDMAFGARHQQPTSQHAAVPEVTLSPYPASSPPPGASTRAQLSRRGERPRSANTFLPSEDFFSPGPQGADHHSHPRHGQRAPCQDPHPSAPACLQGREGEFSLGRRSRAEFENEGSMSS
eukprot:gene17953-24357_t